MIKSSNFSRIPRTAIEAVPCRPRRIHRNPVARSGPHRPRELRGLSAPDEHVRGGRTHDGRARPDAGAARRRPCRVRVGLRGVPVSRRRLGGAHRGAPSHFPGRARLGNLQPRDRARPRRGESSPRLHDGHPDRPASADGDDAGPLLPRDRRSADLQLVPGLGMGPPQQPQQRRAHARRRGNRSAHRLAHGPLRLANVVRPDGPDRVPARGRLVVVRPGPPGASTARFGPPSAPGSTATGPRRFAIPALRARLGRSSAIRRSCCSRRATSAATTSSTFSSTGSTSISSSIAA